ncbi:DUF421 domain-containing protein [Chthonobacter rhizosphaerae]|uniref:DUF421 domain-containing protein n=1 Tax=Chthonobacter rhizosphaerae TaxID=2735553 RepID=UPI0015EF06B0|nr:YetF domain-containing protein [Chthonobacter rhizosphaerae]
MFFDGWADLGRILLVGTLAYGGLVALLRVTGKRTLSKMNAFDLVVTVALGSTLATILLSKDVALAEGLVAFALLCGLQYLVAFLSVRSNRFQSFVKSEPRLLYWDGAFLMSAMLDERVSKEEVLAAARSDGHPSLDDVGFVILETDGSFSIVPAGKASGDLPGVSSEPSA